MTDHYDYINFPGLKVRVSNALRRNDIRDIDHLEALIKDQGLQPVGDGKFVFAGEDKYERSYRCLGKQSWSEIFDLLDRRGFDWVEHSKNALNHTIIKTRPISIRKLASEIKQLIVLLERFLDEAGGE